MPEALALPYVAAWAVACLVAVGLVARSPSAYAITRRAYWRFLLKPWRAATGAIAVAFLVLAAPYAGDPTWDGQVGLLMGLPTFATAPWSIATLWRVARRRLPRSHAWVAVCAWMLSASWGYDLYNLLRHGHYPASWAANLAASSVLYAAAGLCWNLTTVQGIGVTFAFLRDDWPDVAEAPPSARLVAGVAAFVSLVAALLLPFVIEAWRW